MIALAIVAAAAAVAALPEAAPLGLGLKAPEEITLGEHILVELSVEHDPRDVYSLPSFDPAPLAVPPGTPPPRVRREELSKDRAKTIFTLTLTDYGTLEPRVPDLVLHVTGPDGARQLSVHGRPLKFRSLVKEENQGAPDTAHHGPKPPVPVLVRSLLWLWLLLGLAALIAGLLVLRRLRARRQQAEEAPEIPVEADDEALQRLAALRESAPWKRGEGRSAIYTLSEIVRGYLGARLHFNALDLTSEEFLEELHRRRLIGLDLAELTEEVRWEDLVKFAKLEPTAEECLRAVSRSESMVHHTRPLRAIPKKAA